MIEIHFIACDIHSFYYKMHYIQWLWPVSHGEILGNGKDMDPCNRVACHVPTLTHTETIFMVLDHTYQSCCWWWSGFSFPKDKTCVLMTALGRKQQRKQLMLLITTCFGLQCSNQIPCMEQETLLSTEIIIIFYLYM